MLNFCSRFPRRAALRIVELKGKKLSQLVQVPTIFAGLLVTLWTWKCVSLIVFQKKIIYMPYIARRDRVEDYPSTHPISWQPFSISTDDGVVLACTRSKIEDIGLKSSCSRSITEVGHKVVVIYFQGNAGSTPGRLPHLSKILAKCYTNHSSDKDCVEVTFYTLAYRGYWNSTGSPSEAGILKDAMTLLNYVQSIEKDASIVLYGHSIGAGVAALTLSQFLRKDETEYDNNHNQIKGLILETPFISTSRVLTCLYPQKWLPYRYLSPFLRTRLDMQHALCPQIPMPRDEAKRLALRLAETHVLVLHGENDEIVSRSVSEEVAKFFQRHYCTVTSVIIQGALHMDVMTKQSTHEIIKRFVYGIS